MDPRKFLFSTRTHLMINGFHVESRLLTQERKAKLENFKRLMKNKSDIFEHIGSDKWIEVLLTRLYEPTIVTWDDVIDWLKYPESRSFLQSQDFSSTSQSTHKPIEDVLEPLLPADANRHEKVEKDMDSEIGAEMPQENLEQSGEQYKISDISLDLDETAVDDDMQQKTINLETKLASESLFHCPQNKVDVLSENPTVNLQITPQDPYGRFAYNMPSYSPGILHHQLGLNPHALLFSPSHPQVGSSLSSHPLPPSTIYPVENATENWNFSGPCFSCNFESHTLRRLIRILFHVDQQLTSPNQFQNPGFQSAYEYFQQIRLSVKTSAFRLKVKLASCPSCNAQPPQ